MSQHCHDIGTMCCQHFIVVDYVVIWHCKKKNNKKKKKKNPPKYGIWYWLQTFLCLADTRHLQTEETVTDLQATIICEEPIPYLYKFVGTMTIPKPDGSHVERSLGAENVLLRGARLKNTSFIFGK